MKVPHLIVLAACLIFIGCKDDSDSAGSNVPPPIGGPGMPGNSVPPTGAGAPPGDTAGETPTAIPIEDSVAQLAPSNTRIRFIGKHADSSKPDRTGQFGEFTGKIELGENNEPKSILLEIQMDSITTDAGDRLTNHLKSEDFFDVRAYPSASFASKSIQPSENSGEYTITGDLTMHGVTKEISFPATAKIENNQLTLESSFTINRSEFGMTYGPEQVLNDVAIQVAVGTPTAAFAAGGGPGFGGGGRGGPGGGPGRGAGGFDPAQVFGRMDADQDGKLSGNEIPNFVRERLENVDTDGDGAVSVEEFRAVPGGGAGGPGGQGAPSAAPGGPAPPNTSTQPQNNDAGSSPPSSPESQN